MIQLQVVSKSGTVIGVTHAAATTVQSSVGVVYLSDDSIRKQVTGEIPSGIMDGSNAVFESTFDFKPESVEVFVNGIRQCILRDYNTSGTRQIILYASPESSETIVINYQLI